MAWHGTDLCGSNFGGLRRSRGATGSGPRSIEQPAVPASTSSVSGTLSSLPSIVRPPLLLAHLVGHDRVVGTCIRPVLARSLVSPGPIVSEQVQDLRQKRAKCSQPAHAFSGMTGPSPLAGPLYIRSPATIVSNSGRVSCSISARTARTTSPSSLGFESRPK